MRTILSAVFVLFLSSTVSGQTWTVLEPAGSAGRSGSVREEATLGEAEAAAMEAKDTRFKAADELIPRQAEPGGEERQWTVLEPDGVAGKSRVLRERATLGEAQDAAATSVIAEQDASDAVIPSPPPPPSTVGKKEDWTVLGAPGPDGASRAVRKRETFKEAEAEAEPPVESGYKIIRRTMPGADRQMPETGPVKISP